uniref:hypothetical protein n=1 Tax=Pedobacter schmidteae TaxID=2201271 RepID=UPI000EB2F5BD|nr:hypothetical protein [Pedobacter schmidteae]
MKQVKRNAAPTRLKTTQTKGAPVVPLPAQKTEPSETPAGQEKKQEVNPTKSELRAALPQTRNLDATIDVIEVLNRRVKGREKLIETLKDLKQFSLENKEDIVAETDSYFGCSLTITDSKRKEFTTRIPKLISLLVAYLQKVCEEKLTEIETEIVLP